MTKVRRNETEIELGEAGAEKFIARLDLEDLETIEDQCGIGIFAMANQMRSVSLRVSHVRHVLKAALSRSGNKLTDMKLADLIAADIPRAVRATAAVIFAALLPPQEEEGEADGN
jgi:hypothetical protein